MSIYDTRLHGNSSASVASRAVYVINNICISSIGIPLQDAVSCTSQGPFIFSMPTVKKESESRETSYLESEQVVRECIFVPVVTPAQEMTGLVP